MKKRRMKKRKGKDKKMKSYVIVLLIILIIVIIGGCVLYGMTFLISSSNTTQNNSLRIVNSCSEKLWIEGRAGSCSAPLPTYNSTLFPINSKEYIDFNIVPNGVTSTRFWAKVGCDNNGTNCKIGDQDPTWPLTTTCPVTGCNYPQGECPTGGQCPTNGCTPPIDTLLEISFGCSLTGAESSNCNVNPSACTGGGCENLTNTTFFDMSQVDGWTLPYKLTLKGDTSKCNNGSGASNIDGSKLNLNNCPSSENLTNNGQYPTVTDQQGNTYNLDSVNLNYENAGCFSPCQKLTNGFPNGFSQGVGLPPTNMYCCPTPDPNNCQLPECVTPQECRNGPVVTTQYVENVHKMAPGVYAYSYDDGIGLQSCPTEVLYELEFCPST